MKQREKKLAQLEVENASLRAENASLITEERDTDVDARKRFQTHVNLMHSLDETLNTAGTGRSML